MNKWIRLKEQKPLSGASVLVTIFSKKYGYRVTMATRYSDLQNRPEREPYWKVCGGGSRRYDDEDIVAWMPAPRPAMLPLQDKGCRS